MNSMVETTCQLCGSKNFKNVFKQEILAKDFTVVECACCKLFITYPQIGTDEFKKYYSDDYSPYKPEKGGIYKLINNLISRFQSRSFRKRLKKDSSILEIGCSNGNYLKHLKAYGYDVYGIEPGAQAAQRAREDGLDVKTVSFENYKTDKKFDLIIMRHVLEHLADPVSDLKKMRALLKDNGAIYCDLPNTGAISRKIFKGDWYAWQIPFHFFHYDSKNIRLLAEKAGMGVTSVSYSYLPDIMIKSIGLRLNRKGHKAAKYFQGRNPIISLALLPLSFIFGLLGKSGQMSVLFCKRKNRGST